MGATRACPGRARRSGPSSTRRSTAWRRASSSPPSRPTLPPAATSWPRRRGGGACCSRHRSRTRARAEALGLSCKVGIATRAVRVVILSAGLVFAKGASLGDFELLAPAVYVLAALPLFTTFQRIFHVRSQLREAPAQQA